MRRLLQFPVLLSLSALAAAPAGAAWRELPAHDMPGGAGALCLRPAGPGELTVAAGRALQRLTITADALAATAVPAVGRSTLCPEPGDGAVPLLAGPVVTEGRGQRARSRVAVSADGGAPTLLAGRAVAYIGPPAVAVAPSGAAVVAWVERASIGRGSGVVRAALRASGSATFGRPERLGTIGAESGLPPTPQAGIDDAGRAHVAWASAGLRGVSRAHVATAAAGRPFARARTLGRGFGGRSPALAVAADGRALLAAPTDDAVELWELTPGATAFARGQRIAISPAQLSLALRAGGAAALVSHDSLDDAPVALVRRDGPGRFGRAELLLSHGAPARSDGFGVSYAEIYSAPDDKRYADHVQPQVGVALGDRGELVVSWFDRSRAGRPAVPQAWHGTIAGGGRGRVIERYRIAGRGTRLGSPCRVTGPIAPVALADGRLAVAWSDDGRGFDMGLGEWGSGAGRVHVAVPEGSSASQTVTPAPNLANGPAPRASARLLGPRTVGAATPLRLRVRCDGGPCDLRASAAAAPFGGTGERPGASDGADEETLTANATVADAGGSATLRLRPTGTSAFAQPRRSARLPIAITVCTPAGRIAQRLTLRPRLRGRPLPPAPRIAAPRAVRLPDGRYRVTWRLSRPVRDRGAFLSATLYGRDDWTLDESMVRVRGRTRFTVTLDPDAIEDDRPTAVVIQLSTSVTLNAARATVRLH